MTALHPPPRRLEEFGRLVFGTRWQVELAAALGTTTRTIRRWHSDDDDIPEGTWPRLETLAVERRSACDEAVRMAHELEAAPSAAERVSSNEDAALAVGNKPEPVHGPAAEVVSEPVAEAAVQAPEPPPADPDLIQGTELLPGDRIVVRHGRGTKYATVTERLPDGTVMVSKAGAAWLAGSDFNPKPLLAADFIRRVESAGP